MGSHRDTLVVVVQEFVQASPNGTVVVSSGTILKQGPPLSRAPTFVWGHAPAFVCAGRRACAFTERVRVALCSGWGWNGPLHTFLTYGAH